MNNNSKVLALKYRPQTFDDLIGQEVVAETITNSIKADKIPNAYLFTGIRGIGKTTTARIVAKALNCLNGIENLCKKDLCDNCKSIADSSHIDVLEMDAASKTGVDFKFKSSHIFGLRKRDLFFNKVSIIVLPTRNN